MHTYIKSIAFYSNGSALDEWADDAGSGMEEVMRVPVRALYDYNGQEEDELSFKSGKIYTSGSPVGQISATNVTFKFLFSV